MTSCLVVNRQSGFVLASSVWMMAVAMLLAGLFHTWVASQLESAQALQSHQQGSLDLVSTRQTLFYLLSTRRMTSAGLTLSQADQQVPRNADGDPLLGPVGGEIRLDGAVYQGVGRARFSIQDKAGLLGLNGLGMPALIEEWLRSQEGATQSKRLAATLGDYIDENTRRRINGAEALDYRQKGMSPPSNYYLRTPRELAAVLEWRDWVQTPKGAQWYDWGAITRANVLNVNTMPEPVLMMTLGLDAQEAGALVAARRRHPVGSLDSVARELGLPNTWEEQRFRFFPSEHLRLRLWTESSGTVVVESVHLTAHGAYGPFLIDYRFREAAADSLEMQAPKNRPSRLFSDELLADS